MLTPFVSTKDLVPSIFINVLPTSPMLLTRVLNDNIIAEKYLLFIPNFKNFPE